jgi:hypothetical protein
VEMRPFMASIAVIFGVIFTGPHILAVKAEGPDRRDESVSVHDQLAILYQEEGYGLIVD